MALDYLPWARPPGRPAGGGDRPCVRNETTELTAAEFAERVEAAAGQFAEAGVRAGSVVAVLLPNRVELLIAIVAAWRLGAAATPINPALTAEEAGYQVADAGAALIVAEAAPGPAADRPTLTAEQLRHAPAPAGPALPEPATRPDDLAFLIYTSGSTGRPKGVRLHHSHLDAMTAAMVEAMSLTAADHCLLVLPLFHANALCVSFLSTIRAGGQLSVLRRFHPVEFLAAVDRLRPTYFSAVPTIYSHLVSLPDAVTADTSSVRFAVCGAAPAPAALLDAVEQRFGFPVVEGYGLTEATCGSTCNPPDGLRKPGTVGPALPGQTVAVMAPDGRLLPPGEAGEVVIRGPEVMAGYHNLPESTAAALRDGWLHTGDVGVLDEDGYLRLVDRIKDMIIRGGENISPKEIENVLLADPAVLEAAVVGQPDPVYGEVPVGYVAPRPRHAVDVEALRQACTRRLTRFKVPAAITVLDALPKNPVGKIDKPALRTLSTPATADERA
ncbi:class I adenylate-forming enzyme family protein [Mycolicibacillus trivialis]|uniref:class I adenylate-forming enzyme family protein n=3 Tax=Mycolicibacillus trivialis TaxID=1798 RepID=UPI000A162888|nr:AMP-binding protein [Mycolicibacillus trivialis]